mgnify:CR=1 FL=1
MPTRSSFTLVVPLSLPAVPEDADWSDVADGFDGSDVSDCSDGFGGVPLAENPILQYLNRLPLPVRRKIFAVLVGDRWRSMDPEAAFAWSVNLVVHRSDRSQASEILKTALSDHEQFYRTYMEILAEAGKG